MANLNMDMEWLNTWLDKDMNATLNLDDYAQLSGIFTASPEQHESGQQQQIIEAPADANGPKGMLDSFSGIAWESIDFDFSIPPTTSDAIDQLPVFRQDTLPSAPDKQVSTSGLPIDQQAQAYSTQLSQQDNESVDEEYYDNFHPSNYPPLESLSDNSLPYGLRYTQQHNNKVADVYNTGSARSQFNGNPGAIVDTRRSRQVRQSQWNSVNRRGIERPVDIHQKVSLNREAKKRGDPKCDPALWYNSDTAVPEPWGSVTWGGQLLFTYNHKGQWLLDRSFDANQLREYADNCPKDAVFWVQQTPTQCNRRLDPEDRICRWSDCPVPNRSIGAGWLRVVFDEFPALTSDGTNDPLKYAGSMHLWCFEQIFDPMEFHMSGRLLPEDRTFPNEDKNVVTLEKLTDVGIIRDAYRPWFHDRMDYWKKHGPTQVPRVYEESLSYRLNKYHLDNQTAARQKARVKRNAKRADNEKRTIDVHVGNLQLFVEASKRVKCAKKTKTLRTVSTDSTDSSLTFDSTEDEQTTPPSISYHNNGTNGTQAVSQRFNPSVPRLVPTQPRGSYNFRPRKETGLSAILEELSPNSVMSPARSRIQNQLARPNPKLNSRTRPQGNTKQSVSTQAAGERPQFFNPLSSAQVRARPQVQPQMDASKSQNPSSKHRMAFFSPLSSAQTQSMSQAELQGGMQQSRVANASQSALDLDDILEASLFQDEICINDFDFDNLFAADDDPKCFGLNTDVPITNTATKRKRDISDERGDQNKKSAHGC